MNISGGEAEFNRWGWRQILENRGLDIAQPEVCALGGISEYQRVLALAHAHFTPVVNHVWGSAIAVAANLQLLAAMPPMPGGLHPWEPMLEFDTTENRFRDHLLTEPLRIQDQVKQNGGRVRVPGRSGPRGGTGPRLHKRVRRRRTGGDMTEKQTGHLGEWLWPTAFLLCAGWTIWHVPAFLLDLFPSENESLYAQIADLHTRKNVLPDLPGLFGGFADPIDWAALVLMPVFFILGVRSVVVAPMEFQHWRSWDRIALFIGRATMIMLIAMTGVMLYEVFLRYVIEAPTKWANELTLWIAGFLFLCSGFYGMQQRSHIRITLLYDAVPRPVRKAFDVISTFLICFFAAGLVFGSYSQVFINKFYRWEMFGTAFDPPIPATIQPMVLIVMVLIALQSIANLIADWNLEPEEYGHDDIDQDEIEAIKKSVGSN